MAKNESPPEDDKDSKGQHDIGALAQQYVDLWQKQLSGVASDEALAGMMAQTVQLMNTGAATMATMASAQHGSPSDTATKEPTDEPDNRGNTGGGNSGPASAAAPSGADDPVIHELHRRIEQLEERIATLESGSGDKGE